MFSVTYIRFKFNFMGYAFSAAKHDILSRLERHRIFALIPPNLVRRFQGLVYLAQIAGHLAGRFAWQQAAQRSPLYHSALSRDSSVVLQRILMNIRPLFILVTQGDREFWF